MYFLVEPGNLASMEEWFSDRWDLFAGVELTADLFEVFVPWLAVVVAKGDLSA